MGRPFYPHEADDPDLDWLVSNFLYERPDFVPVEAGALPLMLLPFREDEENIAELEHLVQEALKELDENGGELEESE